MTRHNYTNEKGRELVEEIQGKIYENFPKIRTDKESESLVGAKIYVSTICSRCLAEERSNTETEHQKDAMEKSRQESVQFQLEMNNQKSDVFLSEMNSAQYQKPNNYQRM